MSMPQPTNPYDGPQTPPPGMSSGAKILLGLGIGCGVLVLLCCGGAIISGVYFGRGIQQAMSEDPDVVKRVTGEIVAIEIPPALAPRFSMDYEVPFVGRSVRMAIYSDKAFDEQQTPEGSGLVLFQMDEQLGNAAVMRAQFEQSMKESGRNKWEEAELTDTEEFKSEINGSEASFQLGRGKRKQDGKEIWQATGTFTGKGGPALLFIQLDAETFSKDDLLGILKSMH